MVVHGLGWKSRERQLLPAWKKAEILLVFFWIISLWSSQPKRARNKEQRWTPTENFQLLRIANGAGTDVAFVGHQQPWPQQILPRLWKKIPVLFLRPAIQTPGRKTWPWEQRKMCRWNSVKEILWAWHWGIDKGFFWNVQAVLGDRLNRRSLSSVEMQLGVRLSGIWLTGLMRLSSSYNHGSEFWTNFLQINSLQLLYHKGLEDQRAARSPGLCLENYQRNTIKTWFNFLPFGFTGSFPGLNQRPAVMEISGDQSNLVFGTSPVNSNGL